MRILHAAMAASLAAGTTAALAQREAIDDAGSRIVPLRVAAAVSSEELSRRSAVHCVTARDFCLRAWREGEDGGNWFLDVHRRLPSGADVVPLARIALPPGEDPSSETQTIWPHLVREASGALLFGVLRTRSAGFSGGGASETHLILFRQSPGIVEATEVLTVQVSYRAMIRACFTEEETRSRGACHDEFELSGTLSLAPEAASGRPRLALATAARSFPRGARAEETERPRLRRGDLVWERDPACSYRRSFAFDAASGRYAPDRPLPDCSTSALP